MRPRASPQLTIGTVVLLAGTSASTCEPFLSWLVAKDEDGEDHGQGDECDRDRLPLPGQRDLADARPETEALPRDLRQRPGDEPGLLSG